MIPNFQTVDYTIVIISIVGGNALISCLEGLAPWHGQCHVILGSNDTNQDTWQIRFPHVRFSDGRGMSVPRKRQRGVEESQTRIVAILEDTSLPEAGWVDAIVEAFKDDKVAAVAGPVRIDPALNGRYLALGCTEYGRYHPDLFPRLALVRDGPNRLRPVSLLPGNNLAYRRSRVLDALKNCEHGLIEGEVNEILKSRGFSLAFHPSMAVLYTAVDVHGGCLKTRVQHGRLYAGQRVTGKPSLTRLRSVARSLLLPAVLSARTLLRMRYVVKPSAWITTACWILLFESAWALGEGTGYLRGIGRSMDDWR